MKKQLIFYYDFVSPYSWLAEREIRRLQSSWNCEIVYQPILLAGLLNLHATKGPAEVPAKRAYVFRDVLRQALLEGIDPQFPAAHPFNPLLPLRLATACAPEARVELTARIFDLCWVEGADICDLAVLRKAVGELGINWDSLYSASQEDPNKMALKRATEMAAEKGIFGVPMMEVNGELFWGSDRLEQIAPFLAGKITINEEKVADLLNRPAAARRI